MSSAHRITQATTITTSTAEATIGTAVTGVNLKLISLTITNSSATPTEVTIKDGTGGNTINVIGVPATDSRQWNPPGGKKQPTVSRNWTATCADSITSVFVSAEFEYA